MIGGFILIIVSFVVLGKRLNKDVHVTALFDDARGMRPGEFVQMAGVDVGQVDKVELAPDNRAQLSLGIHPEFAIPKDSKFVIKSGILGNTRVVVIEPSNERQRIADGAIVQGDSSDPIGDALKQSKQLVEKSSKLLDTVTGRVNELSDKFSKTTDTFNKLIGDPRRQAKLDATLDNVQETTANLPVLERQVQSQLANLSLQANQMLAGLNKTRQNADTLFDNGNKIAVNVNGTITENRATLRSLLRSADEATSAVAGLTDQLKATLADKDLKQNLTQTTANLASISSRLDSTAASIERISTDPRLASDVRETVTNLRETSASVRNLANRFENLRLPGEKRRPAPATNPDGTPVSTTDEPPTAPKPFSATSLFEPGLVLDTLYDTKVERLRFDANYSLLTGSRGAFYRVGLFDATYGNRLNLQVGQAMGSRTDYRYGLFAGKLGVGLDVRTGPLDLRFDVYDPNRATVNARAKAYVGRDTAVFAGVDALGSGNRATVGIQIKK